MRSPVLSPRVLAIGLGLALLARGACLSLVEYRFDVGDAATYQSTAKTLRVQGVYSLAVESPFLPTAYRPPLYSAFLAAASYVAEGPRWVQLLQAMLSLVTIVAVVNVAARLAPGTEVWVLLLAAVNPFDAVYTGALLSESLTSLLVTVTASVLVSGFSKWRLVASGFLVAMVCLTRDIYLALVPFAGVCWVVFGRRGSWWCRVRETAVVALVAALSIAPWTIRNAVEFGRFIPVSAGRLGYSLWLGTWATNGDFSANDAKGLSREYPMEAFASDAERDLVDEAVSDPIFGDANLTRLFVKRIKQAPGPVLSAWIRRLPRLWFATRFDIFELRASLFPRGSLAWTAAKVALFALDSLLMVAALAGAVLAWRRRSKIVWAVVPLVFTSLIYLPLNSFENRYSQPMLPFVMLLAGFLVHELLHGVHICSEFLGLSSHESKAMMHSVETRNRPPQ